MAPRSTLRYLESPPPLALRGLLECLWIAWDPHADAGRPEDHVIPDACPELIVHLAQPFARHVAGRWVRQPHAFMTGTLTKPWRLRAGARVRTLGMRFRPGAATAVFALHMQAAADLEIPLATLVGPASARGLTASLAPTRAPRGAFAAAARWLGALPRLAPKGRLEVTAPTVRAILAGRGRERIDEVASGLGLPRRRIERAFARDLGIRPKLFARIVRLNAAMALLGEAERMPAALWALEAGFFDQAHLAREFRAVVGRRPGARREADGALAQHFTAPRRLLATLAGE